MSLFVLLVTEVLRGVVAHEAEQRQHVVLVHVFIYIFMPNLFWWVYVPLALRNTYSEFDEHSYTDKRGDYAMATFEAAAATVVQDNHQVLAQLAE